MKTGQKDVVGFSLEIRGVFLGLRRMIRFGAFSVDSGARQLFRDDAEIHLSPKAFDLLMLLLEARPRAVSKATLHERLWPGTFVSDATLTSLVAELRRALEDRQYRLIRTVHRFGYAFGGQAADVADRPESRLTAVKHWILWDAGQVALSEGENILGRDSGVAVWIDSTTVSRRHARIVIHGLGATLEDLGSKNGTYVRDERLTAPRGLTDRDQIRIGSVVLTFRASSDTGPTETGAYKPSE
jgi:DNA-binding winged helix-turn-helix (wHTH) protein